MDGSGGNRPRAGREPTNPPRNRLVAERAACQHGVVAVWQAPELGLTASAIRSRVARGALHSVYTNVVSVAHPRLLTRAGRFMAAVLACGDGAALSHRSAAGHRGLRDDNRATIDVTSPTRRGREIDGISAHSGATLRPEDVEIVDGIPTTTVARTLLDLADHVSKRELEELFLQICRDINHPPDGVNVWIPFPDGGGAEADFLWRQQRLIIEVDGRDVHSTSHAFEHDRRRDQRLTLLGWRVVRFTWRQVQLEPAAVAATVAALLG